jgi:subtilisin family serine protease
MDSGIDKNHPDLRVNSRGNIPVSFIPGESATDDYAGHGTHCAGIAAGKGVGKMGCNGVSSGAEVIPVKVLDKNGVGSWTNILKGLDHIAKYGQPGDVIMMSLGEYDVTSCETSNPSLYSAIRELAAKGFFIVMSAGNDQGDANLNLPGCISGPNIFTVASLDFNCSTGITECAIYSNYGAPAVDWAAPGSAIISTWPGRQYQVMSGTSMACALVAGIIHARKGAPASNGTIECNGKVYQIPSR